MRHGVYVFAAIARFVTIFICFVFVFDFTSIRYCECMNVTFYCCCCAHIAINNYWRVMAAASSVIIYFKVCFSRTCFCNFCIYFGFEHRNFCRQFTIFCCIFLLFFFCRLNCNHGFGSVGCVLSDKR